MQMIQTTPPTMNTACNKTSVLGIAVCAVHKWCQSKMVHQAQELTQGRVCSRVQQFPNYSVTSTEHAKYTQVNPTKKLLCFPK